MNDVLQFFSHSLPKKFRDRAESKSAWESRYSDSVWPQVEHFLLLFCDAFLLRRTGLPRLYPDDKLTEINNEMFRFWPVDELQFPHFQKALRREYGVEILMKDFEGQTLGDLFDKVRHAS